MDGKAVEQQRRSQQAIDKLKSEADKLRERLSAETEARRAAEAEAAAKRAAEAEAARQREAAAAADRARLDAEAAQKAEAEAAAMRAAEAEAATKRAAEAEAARQREAAAAAERARQDAEAAQKAEAEAAAKKAAEAEAARQREAAATAERVRKEAEAKQKAEEEAAAKRAAEAEAARQDAPQPMGTKAAAGNLAERMASSGPCRDLQISAAELPAGRIELSVQSTCLAGQTITLTYGAHMFARTLDANGQLKLPFDLFEGQQSLTLSQPDGTRTQIPVPKVDFSGISKVAVLWSLPVNLDLHAFEYLAPRGGAGHVWAEAPASLDAALAAARQGDRGRGFLSTVDKGSGTGTHAEIYTFVHNGSQRSGAVTLIIDYETRGDVPQGEYCANGRLATIEAQVIRLRPAGRVDKEMVRLGPVPCGDRIPEAKRFNSDTLGDLNARG